MKTVPLTIAEGRMRGMQDRKIGNSYDPFRWIKAWALNAGKFEKGYKDGFYS